MESCESARSSIAIKLEKKNDIFGPSHFPPPLLFHPLFRLPKIGVIFVFRFFRPEPSLWTPLVPHHSRPPQGRQVAESISHPNGKVGKSSTQNCLSGKWYVSSQVTLQCYLEIWGRKNRLWKIKNNPRVFTWKYLDFLSCCIWGILTRASSVAPVCLALEVTRKRLLKKGDSLIKTSGSSHLATKTWGQEGKADSFESGTNSIHLNPICLKPMNRIRSPSLYATTKI